MSTGTQAKAKAIAEVIANLKSQAEGFAIVDVDIETTPEAIVKMWKQDKMKLLKQLPEEQRKEYEKYEKMGNSTPMTMGEAAPAVLLLYFIMILLKDTVFYRAIGANYVDGQGFERPALNREQMREAHDFLTQNPALANADFEAYINELDIPERNRAAILDVGWQTFVPDLLQLIFLATAAVGFMTYPLNNSVSLRF